MIIGHSIYGQDLYLIKQLKRYQVFGWSQFGENRTHKSVHRYCTLAWLVTKGDQMTARMILTFSVILGFANGAFAQTFFEKPLGDYSPPPPPSAPLPQLPPMRLPQLPSSSETEERLRNLVTGESSKQNDEKDQALLRKNQLAAEIDRMQNELKTVRDEQSSKYNEFALLKQKTRSNEAYIEKLLIYQNSLNQLKKSAVQIVIEKSVLKIALDNLRIALRSGDSPSVVVTNEIRKLNGGTKKYKTLAALEKHLNSLPSGELILRSLEEIIELSEGQAGDKVKIDFSLQITNLISDIESEKQKKISEISADKLRGDELKKAISNLDESTVEFERQINELNKQMQG
jgi:hypothetical protein